MNDLEIILRDQSQKALSDTWLVVEVEVGVGAGFVEPKGGTVEGRPVVVPL